MASKSKFARERAAFARLKKAVEKDSELREDIEAAIKQLLGQFATSIRENRFIVGGALEVILTAALRAAGVKAEDVGTFEQRIDIKIPDGGFSVKGHFSRTGNIRLINVLGDSSQTEWDTATIFVLHQLGIGYADPEYIPQEAVKRTRDAVVLPYTEIRKFLGQHPKCLIQCSVPAPTKEPSVSKLVSRVVAQDILQKTKKLKDFAP